MSGAKGSFSIEAATKAANCWFKATSNLRNSSWRLFSAAEPVTDPRRLPKRIDKILFICTFQQRVSNVLRTRNMPLIVLSLHCENQLRMPRCVQSTDLYRAVRFCSMLVGTSTAVVGCYDRSILVGSYKLVLYQARKKMKAQSLPALLVLASKWR